MRGRALAVLLAVVLVLSGCATPFGDDDPASVTPAAVPEGPADAFAPGVTTQGLVGPSLLVDAHTEALRSASYRLVLNRTRLHNGEFRERIRFLATYDPANGLARLRLLRSHPLRPTIVSVTIVTPDGRERFVRSGSGPFERVNASRVIGFHRTLADRLGLAFDSVVLDDVSPRQPDAERYRLSGTRLGNTTALVEDRDQILSARFSAQLTATGLVERYDWRYSFVRGRTNVTILERATVSAVGTTEVDTSTPKQ